MNPNVWGPSGWLFLHSITLNYPKNPTEFDKKSYKDFFYNIKNILPCQVCKKNYSKHMNELPIDHFLSNKNSLVEWLIKIHNKANKDNDKKIYSNEEILKYFKKLYADSIIDTKNLNTILLIVFIILLIIFISLFLIYVRK